MREGHRLVAGEKREDGGNKQGKSFYILHGTLSPNFGFSQTSPSITDPFCDATHGHVGKLLHTTKPETQEGGIVMGSYENPKRTDTRQQPRLLLGGESSTVPSHLHTSTSYILFSSLP